MGIIHNNYYQAEKEKLVFVNRLPKLSIRVINAKTDANDYIFENASQVEGGVSGARHALRVTSVAGVGH